MDSSVVQERANSYLDRKQVQHRRTGWRCDTVACLARSIAWLFDSVDPRDGSLGIHLGRDSDDNLRRSLCSSGHQKCPRPAKRESVGLVANIRETFVLIETLLFAGGGSAGHVIPAIPVIRQFLNEGSHVVFVGSRSGMEAKLLEGIGIEYHGIITGKLRRYFSWKNFVDALRVPLGVLQAILLVWRIQPDVVFSKGGYVGFPVVVASWVLRIPVVAHESDLSPGLANRLSTPFLTSLCVNFPETESAARRVVATGTPLRSELLEGERDRGLSRLGFTPDVPVACIVGGSLGADSLNQVVREAVPTLIESMQIVHICGAGKLDARLDGLLRYRQHEYIGDGWGDVLAATDLVISRAGANSVCELLAMHKPNLLVPLPDTVSRGDQIENARMAELRGYSRVLADEALNSTTLLDAIREMLAELPTWRKALDHCEIGDGTTLVVNEIKRASKIQSSREVGR